MFSPLKIIKQRLILSVFLKYSQTYPPFFHFKGDSAAPPHSPHTSPVRPAGISTPGAGCVPAALETAQEPCHSLLLLHIS